MVAHDLEALHVSLAPGVDFAEKAEGVCSKLGYYHQPYMWMEDYCDTMVADHLGKAKQALPFSSSVNVIW